MAELAAGHTGTKAVVADTDGVILEGVGEIVVALGHGTDEDGDALFGAERFDIVLGAHHGRLETEGDLAAIGWQVVGDWVLDHFQQLLLRVGGADGETVKQLNHQPSKPLKSSRNAHGRVDFDQNALGSVDENLKTTGFVDGGVQEGKEALYKIM